jgi:hypothetical protein
MSRCVAKALCGRGSTALPSVITTAIRCQQWLIHAVRGWLFFVSLIYLSNLLLSCLLCVCVGRAGRLFGKIWFSIDLVRFANVPDSEGMECVDNIILYPPQLLFLYQSMHIVDRVLDLSGFYSNQSCFEVD